MQYVRNLSDSVSTAWNSINPATLSGAIDVIVVEFRVNGTKQDYSMKLGEGGEAFFVFETTDTIPASLQTSPISSPASTQIQAPTVYLYTNPPAVHSHGILTTLPHSASFTDRETKTRPWSGDFSSLQREALRRSESEPDATDARGADSPELSADRSPSPPPLPLEDAVARANALAKELSAVNIPSHITEDGDLMLDLAAMKGTEEDSFRAEILARKILSEELDGNYDIGALIGVDENGNIWIYSRGGIAADAASDPGYHSDGSDATTAAPPHLHRRSESDIGPMQRDSPPITPPASGGIGNPNKNYAKTLRLTSDQLKDLSLNPGQNVMSFTVNRSTCQANMYLWKHDVPVVISDIDGTITKSDALGHVLNMIGRD
ncbi:unnamed protein product [Parascedosporium putredinis]|uniref:LNS2/PITP domain-containing protein n=1 Tax=Parascedosporium putredinis TaxID=1442378 RepID=A0A9P1H9S7_9PEZI|nr:unnamed protein product [Parascedosporium putredinis]CAI8002140.1 unnamed protein product [Parascedosporium putredinis]